MRKTTISYHDLYHLYEINKKNLAQYQDRVVPELRAEIEKLKAERQWISVNDRMPELIQTKAGTAYSEAVAVLTKGRVVLVAVWDGIDWIGAFDYWDVMGEEVTHWMSVMPLPEPPKEEAE